MTTNSHGKNWNDPAYQSYRILRLAFTVAPIIAGIDKFINYLTVWEKYLSPQFNIFGHPHMTILLVGAIEIIAGVGVWLRPKIFSYVVALWLLGIIINLILLRDYYDVALRDLGLLLGALALASSSIKYA